MASDFDDLFAKFAIQLKRLTPAQVMACREVLAELESAGISKPLARIVIDQGLMTYPEASSVVQELNRNHPGKHPPLAPSEGLPGGTSPRAPGTAKREAPAGRARGAPATRPATAPAASAEGRPAAARAGSPPFRMPPQAPSRPVHRSGSDAPPSRLRRALLGAGAGGLVLVGGLLLWLSGGTRREPVPGIGPGSSPMAESVAPPRRSPAPPVPAAPPTPAPPAPPPGPAKPDPRPAPERKPAPAAASAANDDFKRQFQESVAQRRQDSAERLGEVVRELAQERKEADEAAKLTRTRLAGRKVTFSLTSGETVKDAVIRSFTFHGAELQAGGKELRVTWDAVQPAFLAPLADVLFDPQRASDQFDRGRFFVARRRWKDAQAAFGAAAKLGQGFESRVLEFSEVLDRLASGQGGFRGSARRVGSDGVYLSWDFHDPKQLEDFTRGLTLSGAGAALESPMPLWVYFLGGTSSGSDESPLAFVGRLDVRMKMRSSDAVLFRCFAGAQDAYEIEWGPAGASLFKVTYKPQPPEARRLIAKSDKLKLAAGKAYDVRLNVNFPRFRLSVDGTEALSAEDGPVSVTADPPKGAFGFGIPKGKLALDAPLEVEGRSEGTELDRRIGDTEVMVRRALDPDLEQIERFRARRKAMSLLNETPVESLSSDHIYFLERLQPDYNRYEELKKQIGGVPDKQTPEQWKAEMQGLIVKHPGVPSLYYVLAMFKHEHQDLAGGISDLRKAVDLYPEFYEALNLESEMLLERREPEAALAAVRRALEAKPDFVPGYVTRARCVYATSGSLQEFMNDLDIARKLDPQDSSALTVQRKLKYQRLGPQELGCRFEYETAHYRVTSDISPAASRRYGDNLEAAFRHYASSFKGDPAGFGRKPRVSIFMTAENYYTYFELLSDDRGENTLGVFWPELNELVLFEKSGDLMDTNHTLYHEAVHQFMTLLTPRMPPFWYNEGIAEYMGAIRIQDGKVLEKAVLLPGRLPYVQLAIEVKADLPFEKIMNETPREFYSGDVGLKYAQAWSMIHFFYEFDKGRHRPLIEEYFALLRDGKTSRECFDTVFKGKEQTLQDEWRGFTRALRP